MSAAVPVLTALLLAAFAGILLQRYSPAFTLLLSLGAAVWLLLRLGTAAARGAASNGTAGTAHQCTGFFLPFAQRRDFAAGRLCPYPLRGSRSGHACMVRRAGGTVSRAGGGVAAAGTDIPDDLGAGGMKKRGLIISMVILSILCSKTALKAAAAEDAPWQTLSRKSTCTSRAVCGRPAGHLAAFVCCRTGAITAGSAASICRYSAVFIACSRAGISLAGHCRQSTAGTGCCRWLRRFIVAGTGQALPPRCDPDGRVENYLLGFLPVYSGVLAAWRGMERRSGCKRLSAHGAVFYRTGGHSLAAAAAAQLPCHQHGLRHQFPQKSVRGLHSDRGGCCGRPSAGQAKHSLP